MLYAGGIVGLLLVAFWVYCLLDVLTTDKAAIRNLPKLAWVLIVVLMTWLGGLAWLVAGRPRSTSLQPRSTPSPGTRSAGGGSGSVRWKPPAPPARPWVAPDDDPEFLRRLSQRNETSGPSGPARDSDALLDTWEADLRRREEEIRRRGGDDPPAPEPV